MTRIEGISLMKSRHDYHNGAPAQSDCVLNARNCGASAIAPLGDNRAIGRVSYSIGSISSSEAHK